MFKDYNKYLSTSLKVYLFVLAVIFILKIVGLDYFGININSPALLAINNFCLKFMLDDIILAILLYFNCYFMFSLITNENNNKMKIFCLLTTFLTVTLQYFLNYFNLKFLYSIINIVILYLGIKIFKKDTKISKIMFIFILNIIYQIISLFIRNIANDQIFNSFIIELLLNIDYNLMLFLTYKLNFNGGKNICFQDHSLSLLKKKNLRQLQRKSQKNYLNFKKKNKEEKLTIIIYIFLSLIWNILSLFLILLFAKLNNTFIECIFILTSFWLSKRSFGKAFHLPNMLQCFVVSNLTYYILNRITTPLGVSILIPIMLGVGLSYFTSKLVKKVYKPLYKGMPKEMFEETILKVVDKDSVKYKICYDYFILKYNALYLSGKYNYSEAGIRKIKDRINAKIKELE